MKLMYNASPDSIVWRVYYSFDGTETEHKDKLTYGDAVKYQRDAERFGAETQLIEIKFCNSDFAQEEAENND